MNDEKLCCKNCGHEYTTADYGGMQKGIDRFTKRPTIQPVWTCCKCQFTYYGIKVYNDEKGGLVPARVNGQPVQ